MGVKDFVSDFGAFTDEVTSCRIAVVKWRVYARNRANQPATLTMDNANPRHYNLGGDGGLCIGGMGDVTIDAAAGTSITLLSTIVGPNGFNGTTVVAGRIETAFAGDSTVVLINRSDASKFAVGKWVLVNGLNIQAGAGQGYPPNWQRFEFRKILSISDKNITFTEPLVNSYSSRWASVVNRAANPKDAQGGPAQINRMPDNWDVSITLRNLSVLETAGGNVSAREALLENVDFPLTNALGRSPTMSKSVIYRNCQLQNNGSTAYEVDKQVEYLEFDNCTAVNVGFQSCSIASCVIKNGTNFGSLNGTPLNTTITNSTIGGFGVGSGGHGRSESLTVVNSTINSIGAIESFIDLGHGGVPVDWFTYIGNGILRSLRPNENQTGTAYNTAIPGFAYIFAFSDGTPHLTGGSFCVTDFTEDSTYTYVHSTLTDSLMKSFRGKIDPGGVGGRGTGTLTVTSMDGGILDVGDTIATPGVIDGQRIVALSGTGTGGVGTYAVAVNQTLSSRRMNAYAGSISFFGMLPPNEMWQYPFVRVNASGSGPAGFTIDGSGLPLTAPNICFSLPLRGEVPSWQRCPVCERSMTTSVEASGDLWSMTLRCLPCEKGRYDPVP